MREGETTIYHFPAAAIRRDPILARAPENQLFQFFRAWKPGRSKSIHGLKVVMIGFSLVPLCTLVLMELTGNMNLVMPANFLSLALIVTFAIISSRRRKAAFREDRTDVGARSVRQLIDNRQGVNRTVLIDLWMCGVRGSDLAEAIYFELRRQEFITNFTVVLVIFACASIATLRGAGGGNLSDYLFPAALFICGYSLARLSRFGSANGTVRMLKRTGAGIGAQFPDWSAGGRVLLYTLWYVAIPAAVVITIFLFMGATQGFGKLIIQSLFSRIDPAEPYVFMIRVVAACILGLHGAWFAFIDQRTGPANEASIRRILACFDPAFDKFVRVRLLNQEGDGA